MTLEQASAMSALDVLKHAMTRSIVKNDWQSTAVYARDIAPYQLAKLTSSKVDATVRRWDSLFCTASGIAIHLP